MVLKINTSLLTDGFISNNTLNFAAYDSDVFVIGSVPQNKRKQIIGSIQTSDLAKTTQTFKPVSYAFDKDIWSEEENKNREGKGGKDHEIGEGKLVARRDMWTEGN